MNILVFSINYPSAREPSLGIFVYKLMQEFVRQGHNVTVIAPKKITFKNIFYIRPFRENDLCEVYTPFYLSLSNKQFFSFNTIKVGTFFIKKASKRAHKKACKKKEFDVYYAHFMGSAFMSLGAMGSIKKPLFIVAGETPFGSDFKWYKESEISTLINKERSYIAVSSPLRDELVKYGAKSENVLVAHNATDRSIFYKRNKEEMRKKYNIPLDKKIVITVGRLNDPRKGVKELLEAIKDMDNVKGIFLGDKLSNEYSSLSVFNQQVPHNLIPELLSCADVFVLLTANEGSSNAIVEAMTCGLPMVVSAIPEVIEQCDSSFAIYVDRKNVPEINQAIKSIIYDDEKLEYMSNSAMEFSKQYSLEKRAERILSFIEERR